MFANKNRDQWKQKKQENKVFSEISQHIFLQRNLTINDKNMIQIILC